MKKRVITLISLLIIMTILLTGCSLFAKDVTITFDSMGGSQVESIVAKEGTIISKPTSPTRDGYVFGGWYVDREYSRMYVFGVMGSEDITLYANWITNSYSITLHGNGGTGTNITKYDKGAGATLPTDWTREGYRFAGWYEDAEFTSNKIDAVPSDAEGDKEYYAKWIENEPGKYIVTLNGNGGTGTIVDSYDRGTGVTLPNDWTREGYTFDGWYDNASFAGRSVESIGKLDKGDKTFYAKWSPIEYTIVFNTNGGNILDNLIAPYDSVIELPTPTMANKVFEGWYSDEALTAPFNAEKMPLGGATLYAKWADGYTINYVSDGINVDSEVVTTNSAVLMDIENSRYNRPDYYFAGWYLDQDFKTICPSRCEVTRSMTVYAKWTSRSFVERKDYFDECIRRNIPANLRSHEDLVRFIDYTMFLGKAGDYRFNLNYSSVSPMNEVKNVIEKETTATRLSASIQYNSEMIEIRPINGDIAVDNFKTVENNDKKKYSQTLYGLIPIYSPKRSATFDDFAYKDYKETLNVTTSNQLFYALQYRIKPIAAKGSSAEKILAKAKDVLRKICDDSMSDFEKMYAIYCWCIKDVYYDHEAVRRNGLRPGDPDFISVIDAAKYDAWHAEGVFNNGIAVCDGISKAVTILAGIEGISCLRVTSDNHAWNRVYVDVDGNGVGEWYGFDATWANAGTNDRKETASAEHFLFTDRFKANYPNNNQIATNHKDVKAITDVDVYKAIKFEEGDKSYDLVMENSDEITALASYVHKVANSVHSDNNMVCFTIKLGGTVSSLTFKSNMTSACKTLNKKSITDTDVNFNNITDDDNDGIYDIIMLIA